MWNEKRTTSLIDIRKFLRAHGTDLPPWEKPKRVLESLYADLRNKRNDNRFWTDLRQLMRDLEDHRFDPEALRGSETLKDATLDTIIQDLRAELEGAPSKGGIGKWIAGSVTGSALLGFLLLGYSVGCYGGSDDDDDKNYCLDAEENDIPDSEADTYCELVAYIYAADISDEDRATLLDCLPGLDAGYREALVEQFQDLNDEQIAVVLESMLDNGILCSDDSDDDYWTDDDH